MIRDPIMRRLSTNLDDENAQPSFIWDVPVTVRELREHLRHPDPRIRAQWLGRVLREARYQDVWKFVTVDEVLEQFPLVQRHLGRMRRFWEWLLEGWREDGLLRKRPTHVTVQRSFPEFRRFLVERSGENTLVDLVIDRTPDVDPDKAVFGSVRVDSLREIAANKICALVGRSEIRDLIDLRAMLLAGIDLRRALDDAMRKDGGVNPAILAWLLDELVIGRDAVLPGGVDPQALDRFRHDLAGTLRRFAYPLSDRPEVSN
jgi:hypothetical protein